MLEKKLYYIQYYVFNFFIVNILLLFDIIKNCNYSFYLLHKLCKLFTSIFNIIFNYVVRKKNCTKYNIMYLYKLHFIIVNTLKIYRLIL